MQLKSVMSNIQTTVHTTVHAYNKKIILRYLNNKKHTTMFRRLHFNEIKGRMHKKCTYECFTCSLCRWILKKGNRHRNHELARAHLNFEFLFSYRVLPFFAHCIPLKFKFYINFFSFLALHRWSFLIQGHYQKFSYNPVSYLTWLSRPLALKFAHFIFF